jgi:hypothetical protein
LPGTGVKPLCFRCAAKFVDLASTGGRADTLAKAALKNDEKSRKTGCFVRQTVGSKVRTVGDVLRFIQSVRRWTKFLNPPTPANRCGNKKNVFWQQNGDARKVLMCIMTKG